MWVCFFFIIFTSLLYFLGSTHMWYHIVFVFVWLISLSIILWVHQCCCRWQNFILFSSWLVSIMYIYVCVPHICVCVPYIYIPHLYPFVNGWHLGWFHILAILWTVLLWTLDAWIFESRSCVSFRYIPRSGIAESYSNCFYFILFF